MPEGPKGYDLGALELAMLVWVSDAGWASPGDPAPYVAALGLGRRPVSERIRLSVPRYRVEEHSPDLAAFIVGFADTPPQYQSLLARRAAHLTRVRSAAELVVIDQESEAIIVRRDVSLTLKA